MSTVKISELPVIPQINANTANTIFVGLDIPTNITGKMTLTTLAHGLYSNNNLLVGNTFTVLPNAIAQFTGESDLYVQTSLQNLEANGSGDIVVTADNGTDSAYFVDMGMTGSTYNYPGYTVMNKNDGYLLVVGDTPSAQGGNLTIGTVTEGKDITFFQGGAEAANAVAQFKYNTGLKLLKKPLTFADGTTQNTAVDYTTINTRITANVAALDGSVTANAASANSVINTRITANIATANLFTQAAFNKANNALANTSGTFGGSLTVTGALVAGSIATSNLVSFVSSSTPSSNALVEIIGSIGGSQVTPATDGYMLHVTGKENQATRVVFDSFGTGTYPLLAGRSARGSANTPLATQNNDVLLRVSSGGWGTTGFSPLGSGRIDFVATENHSDSARGSKIVFYNVAQGTNTINQIASFNADEAYFTGTVVPSRGVMYTPRLPAGAQTAITVDFSTDSIIKANFSAPVTVGFSNYTAGKIVEVWLINTAGNGQSITHGCLANNSTKGTTSFTVAAGQAAHLKYFSINGDNANTFVAITYN